jgi:hypothetical protein
MACSAGADQKRRKSAVTHVMNRPSKHSSDPSTDPGNQHAGSNEFAEAGNWEPALRNPIVGVAACCARRSGHAAASLNNVMNSRHLMGAYPRARITD